jgi:hypothetical protein
MKLLSIQTTMAALLFLWSSAFNNFISFWPDRILAAQNYLFSINGLVFAWFLANNLRIRFVFFNKIMTFFFTDVIFKSVLLFLILFSALCQSLLFYKTNSTFLEQYASLKRFTLEKAANSVLYTTPGYISPFYLVAVPFVLFSDAEVVKNNTHIYTHWHREKRHNFRYGRLPSNLSEYSIIVTTDSYGTLNFVPN